MLLLLRLTACLPLRATRLFGAGLGALIRVANTKRRRIARINLGLCFPELASGERRRLLARHFRMLGQSYLDAGFLAFASEARLVRHLRLTGLEHVSAALAAGRAVILLAPHCVGLNVGGLVVARHVPVSSMVKAQRDPFADWLLHKIRSRYDSPLIERRQGMRPVVRALAAGRAFYFLPDEDLGPEHSVFATFFGVPTATLTTLGRLARLADAVVLPCFTRLVAHGYETVLEPPLADFPTGDRVADALAMNRALEHGIRAAPEQYMWTFKLFKTRPDGAPSPYA